MLRAYGSTTTSKPRDLYVRLRRLRIRLGGLGFNGSYPRGRDVYSLGSKLGFGVEAFGFGVELGIWVWGLGIWVWG